MYIKRDLEDHIINHFRGKRREGAIVPGIVGCGKTTMIGHLLNLLKEEYEVFSFSGDETSFRSAVATSGQHILSHVRARTNKKALVFVDEVQKESAIFDAVKIAYDEGDVSFIISGSNPAYIREEARRLLQRRATQFDMYPFTPIEILCERGCIAPDFSLLLRTFFHCILFEFQQISSHDVPEFSINDDIEKICNDYLVRGGLPLAWLSPTILASMTEVQKIFERGFEPILKNTSSVSNIVAQDIGVNHSREFSFQGTMQRSRLTRRQPIVDALNSLLRHGYVLAKEPLFFDIDHRSYLLVYSYCDPGIVTYLSGSIEIEAVDRGPRIEGICHARLCQILSIHPLKYILGYFKPYIVTKEGVRFKAGEIDFVVTSGNKKRIIPIEVKASDHVSSSELRVILEFMTNHSCPYGIILYGGKIKYDEKKRLLYWPWFLI